MVIVVGSGAGGATVARELAEEGIRVTLIEKGPEVAEKDAFRCYANTDSEVKVMRTICLGGTTVVSAGNGVRCLEEELNQKGVNLSRYLEETEHELGVTVLPDAFTGYGTGKIVAAAEALGFVVERMPKFINTEKCRSDGRCTFGCPAGAKWSALRFIEAAKDDGARIITGMQVEEVMVKGGEVMGVRSGDKVFTDDTVVLSAGALETPLLLRRLGLPETSNSLFVDTFLTIGGVLKGIGFNEEITMNAAIKFDDFMIYPHFSRHLVDAIAKKGFDVSPRDILGLMVKIKDEAVGTVAGADKVEKGITNRDAMHLSEGASVAGAILTEAGVHPSSLVATPLRGAHPGGTARIGIAVDRYLETEVSGLYVADASVLPAVPGAPPILTIVALAKYVSRIIAEAYRR